MSEPVEFPWHVSSVHRNRMAIIVDARNRVVAHIIAGPRVAERIVENCNRAAVDAWER